MQNPGIFVTKVYSKLWDIQNSRQIQNPVKHLQWSIVQQLLTAIVVSANYNYFCNIAFHVYFFNLVKVCFLLQQCLFYVKKHSQALTNCMHGYDHAHNVHANSITRVGKFMHSVDWEHIWELLIGCPHRPLCFKKIRATTTTVILISNTVVPNPYSHSTNFNLPSFAPLP